MTNIAILCLDGRSDAADALASKLAGVEDVSVFVYSHGKNDAPGSIEIPDEADTLPKKHNFVVADQRSRGFNGMLHVIEDCVTLEQDPAKFLADLPKMMDFAKIDIWLNTVCDGMNYVYSKYNPRLVVEFDDDRFPSPGFDGIVFTSHSNAAWIAYNMANYSDAAFLFDERFSARVFMIIEFLARRKALSAGKQTLALMNMYPTVKSEQGVFKLGRQPDDRVQDSVMKEENEKFTAMGLDIAPDNLIDNVLEMIYNLMPKKEG